jgi:hypothetical protein
MKKIFYFLIITFFCNNIYSQELRFEEVVKVDSTRTKKELFNVSKVWISDTYKNGKAVIQMENEESGIILGKAVIKYEPSFFGTSVPARGYINYTIKISFKDGRYKYEFYDFIHEGSSNQMGQNGTLGLINSGDSYTGTSDVFTKGYRNKLNEDAQKLIKSEIPKIISSLNQFMSNPKNYLNNSKSDW